MHNPPETPAKKHQVKGGWKFVPMLEPTNEMMDAGHDKLAAILAAGHGFASDIYLAMVGAAPPVPPDGERDAYNRKLRTQIEQEWLALAHLKRAWGPPLGWQLVPVEPTDEMETAAENDYEQSGETFPDWKSKWRVMIAVAPAWRPEPKGPANCRATQTASGWICDCGGRVACSRHPDAPHGESLETTEAEAFDAPHPLAAQVASARAEVATWSPDGRASVQLEGGTSP